MENTEFISKTEYEREILRRKEVEQKLKYLNKLDEIITGLSTQFINLKIDEVDEGIEKGLGKIGGALFADRAYVFILTEDGNFANNTHEWCTEGIVPQKENLQGIPCEVIPWWMQILKKFGNIHIPRVSEMPIEAENEKVILEEQDVSSVIVVPIIYGERLLGFIGFDSVQEARMWSEDAVKLLRMVGDMTANVLQKRIQEQELIEAKERAEAANNAKTQFLANMSHELRTPLNGVMGMLDILLDTELTDEQKEYVQISLDSSEGLLKIVSDILDFARAESGKMELEEISFELNTLVEMTIDSLKYKAKAKGLEINTKVEKDLPKKLMGDPMRIRQILVNLIGNAIKFTDEGEIKLSITKKQTLENLTTIEFMIEDTGVGIPEEKIPLLFKMFSQVDDSYSRKHEGTGLGLAISKQLVNLMGGDIWVESKEGEGSSFGFTITLPLDTNIYGELEPLEEIFDKRILVIEEDQNALYILKEALSRFGAKGNFAQNEKDGIYTLKESLLNEEEIDLLLIGTKQPLEIIKQIKGYKMLRNIPIVMLLAEAGSEFVQEAKKIGVAQFLNLPIDLKELHTALKEKFSTKDTEDTKDRKEVEGNDEQKVNSEADKNEEALQDKKDTKKKILLVEDNHINQKLALMLLRKRDDVTIFTANNGEQCLKVLEKEPIDLVLMDIQMPVMDGFEATKNIREKEVETGKEEHLPIIAVTAHAIQGYREKCFSLGMDEFITKPLKSDILNKVLDVFLDGQKESKKSQG